MFSQAKRGKGHAGEGAHQRGRNQGPSPAGGTGAEKGERVPPAPTGRRDAPRFGIRTKLAGTYLLVIAVILVVINGVALRALEESYLHDRGVKTLANANIIALAGQETLLRHDRSTFYFVRDFGTQMEARVLVLDRKGRVAVDSFGEKWLEGQLLEHEEVTSALSGTGKTGVHRLESGERVLYAAVPIIRDESVAGAVMLVTDLKDIDEAVADTRRLLAAVSAAGGVLALLVGLMLADHFANSLNRLADAVRMIAAGHFNRRVEINSRDEIGLLARDLNEMAAKLEEADRTLRHFLADASHELKTPLSSIKVLAQSLLEAKEMDPEVCRDFLRDINGEADRMAALVDDMLHLTKLDDPDYPVTFGEERVGPLLTHIKGLLAGEAAQKGIAIHLEEEPQGISWPLNGQLFTRIFLNLLDNAVRYTQEGGRVTITAAVDGEELAVRVEDNGPGIPPEALPYIFDRFYRVDRARSRATGGTGLGLAIVRQAVRRHGGTVAVESAPGKGTAFEVRFPRTPPQREGGKSVIFL